MQCDKKEYGTVIAIKTDHLYEERPITIHDIPNTVVLNNIKYELFAFIDLKLSKIKGIPHHYINYTYRENQWEKYDDQRFSAQKVRSGATESITPHMIFFKQN